MGIKAETTFSLKDQLFNKDSVAELAIAISKQSKKFDSDLFQKKALEAFPDLELKDRMVYLADLLHEMVPGPYPKKLQTVLNSLPDELDPNKTDDDFGSFIWGVPGIFVAQYGCTSEHLEISLSALKEMTKRFSSEFPLRFFLNKFPKETLVHVKKWSVDQNYHVRRLASEGIRPSLPWAQKVSTEHDVIVKILDNLYSDPTRYVTRSVANNLNDISKLDPDLVLKTLQKWKKSGKQESKEIDFIISHSLRTLMKQGNPKAMKMLGFDPAVLVECHNLKIPNTVHMGDSFYISFDLIAQGDVKASIKYELGYRNARGGFSPKVFRVADKPLEKDTKYSFRKKNVMRPMTTRTLYPGKHTVTIIVNGKRLAVSGFTLVA